MQYISFPTHEIPALLTRLDAGKPIYTTRVSDEYGKYKAGTLVKNRFLGVLAVTKVRAYKYIRSHPFYDELTEQEKNTIKRYVGYEVVELRR